VKKENTKAKRKRKKKERRTPGDMNLFQQFFSFCL